jgi:hypothetical protein
MTKTKPGQALLICDLGSFYDEGIAPKSAIPQGAAVKS